MASVGFPWPWPGRKVATFCCRTSAKARLNGSSRNGEDTVRWTGEMCRLEVIEFFFCANFSMVIPIMINLIDNDVVFKPYILFTNFRFNLSSFCANSVGIAMS